MNVLGRSLTGFSVGLAFTLAACSGGGGDGGGSMFIETCNLGCGSGQGGTQVTCQYNQTAINQEIAVYFSEDVDESSIDSASFEIVEISSGASPNGTRFRDPNNPRKIVFRPAVTFESDGTISFGFLENATYRVTVEGVSQGDDGPYIRSTSGAQNQSRLLCDFRTSQSAIDLVPGAPTVTVLVKQAVTSTPDVADFIPDVQLTAFPEVMDVWRGSVAIPSDVIFTFNDLMNPATLADPQSGQAAFVTIDVDLDGNLSTTGDRTTLFGSYIVELDPIFLRTTMTFTPSGGLMPSSGSLDPLVNPTGLPRQIVVTVPGNLQDVAGNGISNPGVLPFVTEFIQIDAVILPDADGEDFDDTSNADLNRTSAVWGAGKLTRGQGGGRGRLGSLRVRSSTTLVIDTDSQTFPFVLTGNHDVMTDLHPVTDYDPLDHSAWPTITVTDGAFEFANLVIEQGGTLRFTGGQPARVLVRGNVNIQGVLDLSGGTPLPHASNLVLGGEGGTPGPNAGAGGGGSTRLDSGGSNLIGVGGVDVPDADVYVEGRRGVGLGNVNFIAGGFGGDHWPVTTPLSVDLTPPNNADLRITDVLGSCISAQVSMPGGGGGYATDGLAGIAMTFPGAEVAGDLTSNLPPVGSSGIGGDSDEAGLEPPGAPPVKRKLTFELGYLRGGAGGGGGGANVYGTESNAIGGSCGSSEQISTFRDHSGCGGGGGGGACQLVCGGQSLSISGLIDASGGDGGSTPTVLPGDTNEDLLQPKRGTPGGGGSGGAIRIQAQSFPDSALASATPPRLNIDGGLGGLNSLNARGGKGGAGLVRLEGLTISPTASNVATLMAPTDTDVVGLDAINVLSIGPWNQPRVRPETYSGAASCWMRPQGSFFQIVFIDDTPANPDPDLRYGWDMDVIFGPSSQHFSYRDPANSPFAGESFEQRYPNLFGAVPGSYLTVRFQGARGAGDISDLCNVDESLQIVAGSLTPWVTHPADLNTFSPRPDMIRFAVVFDFAAATPGSEQAQIQGITALRIRTQPD